MKFFRVMLFLLVGLGALVLGFYFGLLKSSSADDGSSMAADQSAELAISRSVEKQQVNLLLVSLGSHRANNLEAAWLVSLHTQNPHRINMVPLYPNVTAGSEQLNDLLQSQFAISTAGEIAAPFLDTLQAMYMVEWDAYITLDRSDFSQAVDYLGGSLYGEQIITGDQALELLDESIASNSNHLNTTAELIAGMCRQITRTIDNSRLSSLSDFLAAHTTILASQGGFSTDLLRRLIFDPKLSCEFPTLIKN